MLAAKIGTQVRSQRLLIMRLLTSESLYSNVNTAAENKQQVNVACGNGGELVKLAVARQQV